MKNAYSSTATRRAWSSPTRCTSAHMTASWRAGLRFYRVEGEVGMIDDSGARGSMAPCPAGEEQIVLGKSYAATSRWRSAARAWRRWGRSSSRTASAWRSSRRSRSPTCSSWAPAAPSRSAPATWMGPAPSCGCRSPPAGSARRGSWRPPRAVRRRTRHLVAARAGPLRRASGRARQARDAQRDAADAPIRRSAAAAWRSSTTTATRVPGRSSPTPAARLPAAADRRSALVESGEIEMQVRRGRLEAAPLALDALPGPLLAALASCRRSCPERAGARPTDSANGVYARRRVRPWACSDSTAPTRRRRRLRRASRCVPWTLPNAIGFARLALIPVPGRALSSEDGVGARRRHCSG